MLPEATIDMIKPLEPTVTPHSSVTEISYRDTVQLPKRSSVTEGAEAAVAVLELHGVPAGDAGRVGERGDTLRLQALQRPGRERDVTDDGGLTAQPGTGHLIGTRLALPGVLALRR